MNSCSTSSNQRFRIDNKAAEKLHLATSSINSAIKSIEQELDIKLFDKNSIGSKLTVEGELAVQYAQQILDIYSEMKHINTRTSEEPPLIQTYCKELKIYATPHISLLLSNAAIKDFMQKYPHTVLQLLTTDPAALITDQDTLDVDIAFISSFSLEWIEKNIDPHKFICRQLLSYETQVAVEKHHPLAAYKSISMSKVVQYPIGILKTKISEYDPINQLASQHPLNYGLITDNESTLIEGILSGKIIVLLSDGYIHMKEWDEAITFLKIRGIPSSKIFSLISKEAYAQNQNIIEDFLQIVQTSLKKMK